MSDEDDADAIADDLVNESEKALRLHLEKTREMLLRIRFALNRRGYKLRYKIEDGTVIAWAEKDKIR